MMKAEQTITTKYRPRGLAKGGELLLRHDDAIQFVRDCKTLGLAILGMDFYREDMEGLVELPGSADYSELSEAADAVERSAAAARRLIGDQLPDGATWVSFVVTEPSVPRPVGARP